MTRIFGVARRLRAFWPSAQCSWPCGQPTCTGQCALCKISLKTGPAPRPPSLRKRHKFCGNLSAQGYVRLGFGSRHWQFHRLVMELFRGEPVPAGHCVHHKDGNKLHNCPCNLEVLTRGCHTWHHKHTQPLIAYCKLCSAPFRAVRDHGKPRLFCGRACYHAWQKLSPAQRQSRARAERQRRQRAFLN